MTSHELPSSEQDSGQGVYEIDWPSEVTEADSARLAVYIQEGSSPDEAAAFAVLAQTEELERQHLSKIGERLQKTPRRYAQVKDHLRSIFGQYMSPARTLIRAKEIEAKGADMPVLLDDILSAENLRKHFAPGPGQSIESFNESIAWVERSYTEGALRRWEGELQLLQLLKDRGPAGVVDNAADTSLRLLSPNSEIGKKMKDAVDLGRQRFHSLNQEAQKFTR